MKTIEIPKTERDFDTFFTRERKRTIALLCGKFNFTYDSAEDVYQDACIALFQNIKSGKLRALTSSLSSYFTQVCVFQSLKKIRDTRLVESLDDGQYDLSKVEELLGFDAEFSIKQQRAMEEIVNSLPVPCNRILWLYYYDNMSMESIAKVIDFKSADSVKAKKAQCMNKLKERFSKRLKEVMYGEDE